MSFAAVATVVAAAALGGAGFGYLLALSDARRCVLDAAAETADDAFEAGFNAGYEAGHDAGRRMQLRAAVESTDNIKLQGCGRN